MDNLRRNARVVGQRPAQDQPQVAAAAPAASSHPPTHTTQPASRGFGRPKGNSMKNKIIAGVVALLLIAALAVGAWMLLGQKSGSSLIDNNKYQAVFLTNGQVYFGKLTDRGEQMLLTKIFYLQATDASANPQNNEEQQQSNDVQLIKLGTEVHGPTDEMIITKEQVLFYENLKDEGNVVQSINQYYEQNN